MENKLKAILGEYAFIIASLQVQVETLQKENEELKEKCEKPTKKQ